MESIVIYMTFDIVGCMYTFIFNYLFIYQILDVNII